MPTLDWPVYADHAVAGICRLRRLAAVPGVAGIRRLWSGL